MSEMAMVYISVIKLAIVCVCAFLYSFAGRDKTSKAWRRFVAPAILVLAVCIFSVYSSNFNLGYIACYPFFCLAYCMGYGADKTWLKIVKRTYCGLAVAAAGLPIVVVTGSWLLFALQAIVGVLASVLLGVYNPTDAAEEETLIGFTGIMFVQFYL